MSIFEPIIRGIKSDIFDWDQVQNPFHICKIQLQKKKSGVKKCLEIMSIKGGGSDAKWKKTILNFHFDFWIISLIDGIGSFNIFLLLRKSFSNLYSLIISTRVGYMIITLKRKILYEENQIELNCRCWHHQHQEFWFWTMQRRKRGHWSNGFSH